MDGYAADLKTIFCEAREISSPEERTAYVDQACAGNAQLRAEVEELLVSLDQAGEFLEDTPIELQRATQFEPPAEQPGSMVGHYRLKERIAEGGMGAVYAAEQEWPVRRTVALKIIKPGMDTREVIARFEAERQALALMDHPHIAHVLDAGATDSGRPYFVMQLVCGVPITEYCSQSRLSVRQRLELFLDVCHAIAHAHQKGVIHRDIKPSNLLVALHDGVPLPKVIDFGIAKATDRRLTEHTLNTRGAQMIGTPLYMSPEQADMSGLDVDTRSDVYSLGALLYELLTGTTTFDSQMLRKVGYDDMRRIIREVEPPRPSADRRMRGELQHRLLALSWRAAKTGQNAPGRAGLDRDEGPGEGPRGALPVGQCVGGRGAALLE